MCLNNFVCAKTISTNKFIKYFKRIACIRVDSVPKMMNLVRRVNHWTKIYLLEVKVGSRQCAKK